MALAELQKLIDSVRDLTGKLRAENDEVRMILDEYTERVLKSTKSFNIVGDIRHGLAEIKADLEILQEQATDQLVIKFVGSVNSGKSSLINALLREDCLPTTCGESTMCLFKICTTEEERWSVQRDGGKKRYGDHVNWPQKLCKTLPENVVLYDTPGFGEEIKVEQVVKNTCQTADIIVAVMDIMSPQLVAVSKLVNEVKCKFTFGVYTKWDEFIQNSKRKVCVDENYLKRKYRKKYLKGVEGAREAGEKAEPQPQKEAEVETEAEAEATIKENGKAKAQKACRGEEDNKDDDDNDDEDDDEDEDDEEEDEDGDEDEEDDDNDDFDEEEEEGEKEEEETVFFVDVGCVEQNNLMFANCQGLPSTDMQVETDGTEGNKGFLKFEKRLAESAKQLKGVIIKGRAESVTINSEKVFGEFQNIIVTRRESQKAKLDRLEEEVASVMADHESLSEIRQNVRSTRQVMEATFTEEAIVALGEEFEKIVKNCESEKEALEKFLDVVNSRIRVATDSETRKVKTKYEEWKNNLKSSYRGLSKSLSGYKAPHLKKPELPKESYEKEVLHTLITSKVFWGATLAGGAIVPAVAVGAALPALGVGAAVAEGAGAAAAAARVGAGVAAGAAGGGLAGIAKTASNAIYGNPIMSQKKIDAWEEFLANEIKSMTKGEECTDPIIQEINRILEGISTELEKKSTDRVQVVKRKFEELLGKQKNTEGDLEDQTENQSATNSAGTPA
ncbi:hypothetical protein ACROYT_G003678 [Oculina patagonica]